MAEIQGKQEETERKKKEKGLTTTYGRCKETHNQLTQLMDSSLTKGNNCLGTARSTPNSSHAMHFEREPV